MKSLRIVFAGTPAFGIPCLNALQESAHKLVAIYTQPDRPSGRGRAVLPSPVKLWGQTHNIPIYQPLHFKEAADREALAALSPDVMVVIAYGLILPPQVLTIPPLGCINVHASLLPRWRGASPIQQALLHNDDESGVSIMQMDAGMDTGPVFMQRVCPAIQKDCAQTLHTRLSELSVTPLMETLNALAGQGLQSTPQDNLHATYAGKIHKEDAHIHWQNSASSIDCAIRAFNPWPVAYTYADDTLVRIHEAQVLPFSKEAIPGTLIALGKEGLTVSTGKDALLIRKIQFPGTKILTVAEWLNGGRNTLSPGVVFT